MTLTGSGYKTVFSVKSIHYFCWIENHNVIKKQTFSCFSASTTGFNWSSRSMLGNSIILDSWVPSSKPDIWVVTHVTFVLKDLKVLFPLYYLGVSIAHWFLFSLYILVVSYCVAFYWNTFLLCKISDVLWKKVLL